MDLDSLPPITLTWALLSLLTSLLEHIHLLTSFTLFYSPTLALHRLQLWRLVTTFTYFGPFSLDFLFHLFFFLRYSRMLEHDARGNARSHGGGTAGYLWLLICCATALLVLSPVVGMPFLGSPLAFVLVYIWARRNRHVRLSLFGVLVVGAPYLPWSLAAFGWAINGSLSAVKGDLVGIAVGHLYYFLVDVWPREFKSGGRNWLQTPALLTRLVDGAA